MDRAFDSLATIASKICQALTTEVPFPLSSASCRLLTDVAPISSPMKVLSDARTGRKKRGGKRLAAQEPNRKGHHYGIKQDV